MRRAAVLDDGYAPIALSGLHQVVEMDPGVRDLRNLQRRAAYRFTGCFVEQAGADEGDAVTLRPVEQPFRDAMRGQLVSGLRERGHGIYDHATGFMLLCEPFYANQECFRAAADGAGGDHAQGTVLYITIQPDSNRAQVADDLAAIRIETDEHGALAASAG